MPERILVADDDPDILQFVRVNLELEGFEVEVAHDGKEAIAKVMASPPDLVLLDVMMPAMDGLPGNFRISSELERRIAEGGYFAVVHADLDNFKAFNDHYGFMRGDLVLKFTANTLIDAAVEIGDPSAFVGP